jgi:hypothetical protein
MLTTVRTRAVSAVVLRRIAARSYYSSSSSSDSVYASSSAGGYSAYSSVEPVAAYSAAPASASIEPLSCMNRNARKPKAANHGARPNSNYNRKMASPEFGSWRHVGMRPGQTPKPRAQPGTPACIAEVVTLSDAAVQQQANKTTGQQ